MTKGKIQREMLKSSQKWDLSKFNIWLPLNDANMIIERAKLDFICRKYNLKPEEVDEEFCEALRLQVKGLKELKTEVGGIVCFEDLLWFIDWFGLP